MITYLEHQPPSGLARLVECLWVVVDPEVRPLRPPERIVPDGCPELIVHLADRFARRTGGRWAVQPRAFLAGTLSRPWQLRAGRRVHTLGVRFRPGAAAALFGVSLKGAADREVLLGDLVGSAATRALTAAMRRAATEEGRFAAAEEWLSHRLAMSPDVALPVEPAVALIRETRGQAPIAEIASRLGWTSRRMERLFSRCLGIRPKLYARIVRLNAALATFEVDERASAVELALEAGYFDQAHLLKDFRTLAGRTPRARRESDGELARHFTRPERLRQLLAGE